MSQPFGGCPRPLVPEMVVMGHGGGGAMTRLLIDSLFHPALQNPWLDQRHDGAVVDVGGQQIALSTDGYVVQPLEFPGGDIASLAVHGTVNDLAMCGAKPILLTASFVLEEGLETSVLRRLVESMGEAARRAGVAIAAADTKVVERGRGDGLHVVTAGIGVVPPGVQVGPREIRPGDAILLSGDVGRHGIAIMAAREGLELESEIRSDSAAVHDAVQALFDAGVDVHCLRDLTRGGLATALVELAKDGARSISLEEERIEVHPQVRGACELLGLDPLYVANEGRFVAVVPAEQEEKARAALRRCEVSAGVRRIGVVEEGTEGRCFLASPLGSRRVLELLSGEQLPRIC